MILSQQSLTRSQCLHLPNNRNHGLRRTQTPRLSIAPQPPSHYQCDSVFLQPYSTSTSQRVNIAPQLPSHYQRDSVAVQPCSSNNSLRHSFAPSFHSTTRTESHPQSPSLTHPLFLEDISDHEPLLDPGPNPEDEVSRWSSDSDDEDSALLFIPKSFVKSKTLSQLQLPRRVSSWIGGITSSMKKRFGWGEKGKESTEEENESPDSGLSQEEEREEQQSEVSPEDQEQEEKKHPGLTAHSTESPESLNKDQPPTTKSIFKKHTSLSSFFSMKSTSSSSTIKPKATSSTINTTTTQSSSSSMASTRSSSSTIKPSRAVSPSETVVCTSQRSGKIADQTLSAKKKVATPGKNDGVWICCLCRKWSFDAHPVCGKCRKTGSKKVEFFPCRHEKCGRCEQFTELCREKYGKRGCVGLEANLLLMLEKFVGDIDVPVAGDMRMDEKEGGDSRIGGWI
ncbi:hypothetical protein ONS96_014342 [Cadophora gregata f. sp. sojae]|nr:hypothetical protein ONS96_014342 [Cadophora gregata f. sp. sojae]